MSPTRLAVAAFVCLAAGAAPAGAQANADPPPDQPPTLQLACRGSQEGFRIDAPELTAEERDVVSPGGNHSANTRTLFLYFLHNELAATPDGSSPAPGTCTSMERALDDGDPNQLTFDTSGSTQVFDSFFKDPNHSFTFPVQNRGSGSFVAIRDIEPSDLPPDQSSSAGGGRNRGDILQNPADGLAGRNSERNAERAKIDCSKGPLVGRIDGSVTSSQTFTIEGACFGDGAGRVALIGLGRNVKPVVDGWNDTAITVVMPRVTGEADRSISLTVVGADGRRSAAKEVSFVAEREEVEVPSRAWQPSPHYMSNDVIGASEHSTYVNYPSRTMSFNVRVNDACTLEGLEIASKYGEIEVVGWEQGQAYEKDLKVTWIYKQLRYTVRKTVAHPSGVEEWEYGVDFQLTARASCPLGIKP